MSSEKKSPSSSEGENLATAVRRVIQVDRANRKIGITDEDDLFTLSQIERDKVWDSTAMPAFRLSHVNQDRYDCNTSSVKPVPIEVKPAGIVGKDGYTTQDFMHRFYAKYAFLQEILDLPNQHIVIAGGSVQQFLSDKNPHLSYRDDYDYVKYHNHDFCGKDSDLDCFFVGLTPEEAMTQIESIVTKLKAYIEKNKGDDNDSYDYNSKKDKKKKPLLRRIEGYIRSPYALTIILDPGCDCWHRLQFVFRCYSTISEVIHGFDLGSCAVAFDGKEVYFTGLSKFSYEYGMNILDTSRRSTSYEYRILKYMKRGFGLIVPRLRKPVDKAMLENGSFEFKLPLVTVKATLFEDDLEVSSGSKSQLWMIDNDDDWILSEEVELSDYFDPNEEIGCNDYRWNYMYAMKFYRLHYLLSLGKTDRLTIFNNDFEEIMKNRAIVPKFCWREKDTYSIRQQLDKRYKRFREVMQLYVKISSGQINFSDVENKIMSAFPTVIRLLQVSELIGETFSINEIVERDLLTAHQKLVMTRWDQFETENSEIKWIVKEPGTQIDGSINPIIEEEWEWYGFWYNAPPELLERVKNYGDSVGFESHILRLLTGGYDEKYRHILSVSEIGCLGSHFQEEDTFGFGTDLIEPPKSDSDSSGYVCRVEEFQEEIVRLKKLVVELTAHLSGEINSIRNDVATIMASMDSIKNQSRK